MGPAMPIMGTATSAHSSYSPDQLYNNMKNAKPFGDIPVTRVMALLDKGVVMSRRIVKVLIADPNENVPLSDCLLFQGEEKLTDATDQELFFELDIKSLLDVYNQKRTLIIDKKVKDRTEYLEPAKVRDLKMIVVTVATL